MISKLTHQITQTYMYLLAIPSSYIVGNIVTFHQVRLWSNEGVSTVKKNTELFRARHQLTPLVLDLFVINVRVIFIIRSLKERRFYRFVRSDVIRQIRSFFKVDLQTFVEVLQILHKKSIIKTDDRYSLNRAQKPVIICGTYKMRMRNFSLQLWFANSA